NGIWRGTYDAAQGWRWVQRNPAGKGAPATVNLGRVSIAAVHDGSRVYAAFAACYGDGGFRGVFLTQDRGATWVPRNPIARGALANVTITQGYFDLVLAVSPGAHAASDRLYLGGQGKSNPSNRPDGRWAASCGRN